MVIPTSSKQTFSISENITVPSTHPTPISNPCLCFVHEFGKQQKLKKATQLAGMFLETWTEDYFAKVGLIFFLKYFVVKIFS